MVELSNFAEEFLDEILEILWVELEEGGKESVSLDEIVVGSVPVLQEPITILKNKGSCQGRWGSGPVDRFRLRGGQTDHQAAPAQRKDVSGYL